MNHVKERERGEGGRGKEGGREEENFADSTTILSLSVVEGRLQAVAFQVLLCSIHLGGSEFILLLPI